MEEGSLQDLDFCYCCKARSDLKCNFCEKNLCHDHRRVCQTCSTIVCCDCRAEKECVACSANADSQNRNVWIENLKDLYESGKPLNAYYIETVWKFVNTELGICEEAKRIRMAGLERAIDVLFTDCGATTNSWVWISKDAKLGEFIAGRAPTLQLMLTCNEREHVVKWFEYLAEQKELVFRRILCKWKESERINAWQMISKRHAFTCLVGVLNDKSGGELISSIKEAGIFSKNEICSCCLSDCANLESLIWLLESGVEMDATREGVTAFTHYVVLNMVEFVKILLNHGASLDNLLVLKCMVPLECLKVILENKGPAFLHAFEAKMLLPQQGFNENYLLCSTLNRANFSIPEDFMRELKSAYGGRYLWSHKLSCLAAMYCLKLLELEDLALTSNLRGKVRAFIETSDVKVDSRTLRLLSKETKDTILTFLMCLKRLERVCGKLTGRDLRFILIDYCFSSPELVGK